MEFSAIARRKISLQIKALKYSSARNLALRRGDVHNCRNKYGANGSQNGAARHMAPER